MIGKILKKSFTYPAFRRLNNIYGDLPPSQWPAHVRVYVGQGWSMAVIFKKSKPFKIIASEEKRGLDINELDPLGSIWKLIEDYVTKKSPLVIFLGIDSVYKDIPQNNEDILSIKDAALCNKEHEALDSNTIYNYYEGSHNVHFFGSIYPKPLKFLHETLNRREIPVEVHDEITATWSVMQDVGNLHKEFPSLSACVFKNLCVWMLSTQKGLIEGVHLYKFSDKEKINFGSLTDNMIPVIQSLGIDTTKIKEFIVGDTTGFLPTDVLPGSIDEFTNLNSDISGVFDFKNDILKEISIEGIEDVLAFKDRHFPVCITAFSPLGIWI